MIRDQDDEPFGHEPEVEDEVDDDRVPAVADAAPAPHIPHRYRRSIGASALAAGMIGLRDILEEPKDNRPVVEQFADEGDRERPIEVDLDPDDPAASVVTLRDVDD